MRSFTTLVLISPDAQKLIQKHEVDDYYHFCQEFGKYHTGVNFTYVVCEATDELINF